MSVAGHTNSCISEPAVAERLRTGVDNWAKNNSQWAGQEQKVPALYGFSSEFHGFYYIYLSGLTKNILEGLQLQKQSLFIKTTKIVTFQASVTKEVTC